MQIPGGISPIIKPWYLMFTSCYDLPIYAYDPDLEKWHHMPDHLFPLSIKAVNQRRRRLISFSYGLVCFVDRTLDNELFVCNPITKACKRIKAPPNNDGCLTINVDRKSHVYTIAIVNCYESGAPPGVIFDHRQLEQRSLEIEVYDSETRTWVTSVDLQVLTGGWKGGLQSVICNGVLYYCILSTDYELDGDC